MSGDSGNGKPIQSYEAPNAEMAQMLGMATIVRENRTSKGTFKKGVSGNPKGRPHNRLRSLLKRNEAALIKGLIDLALDGKDYVRLKALQVAFLYLYGKPKDSLDHEIQETVERVNAIIRKSTKDTRSSSDKSQDKIQ